jgi:hypothetical protein
MARFEGSGKSRKAFAAEAEGGLAISQYWLYKLQREATAVCKVPVPELRLVPVTVRAQPTAPRGSSSASLACGCTCLWASTLDTSRDSRPRFGRRVRADASAERADLSRGRPGEHAAWARWIGSDRTGPVEARPVRPTSPCLPRASGRPLQDLVWDRGGSVLDDKPPRIAAASLTDVLGRVGSPPAAALDDLLPQVASIELTAAAASRYLNICEPRCRHVLTVVALRCAGTSVSSPIAPQIAVSPPAV